MKILEMRPRSYDKRMESISRGRIRGIKEAVAGEVRSGSHVLEIGCGTRELAALIIERDCTVEGFDLSPSTVRPAAARIKADNLNGRFSVRQMGIEAMDGFESESFDAIVSTFVFSELNENGRLFSLKHAARILRPAGSIVVADEVVPQKTVQLFIHNVFRIPLVALGDGDKKLLFYAESIEETALCAKGKMATTSGREAGLRLKGFSGKWLEE